jgi:hypothetical protein
MRAIQTYCIVLAMMALTVRCSSAYTANDVAVAIVADRSSGMDVSSLVSLLEVALSRMDGITLLERTELEHVLTEQQLSISGLLDRATAIKIGRMLRVQAFLLLSAEEGRTREKDPSQLVRIRLVETTHGLRLWDIFESLDTANVVEIVHRVTDKVGTMSDNLTLPTGKIIPIGIVDVHRVQLGEGLRWLTRAIPSMLSARLGTEPRVVMLEREALLTLRNETTLTEGDDAEFWKSAVLIEGHLQPGSGDMLQLTLHLTRASGDEIAAFTAPVDHDEPLPDVDKVAGQVVKALLDTLPTTTWEPKKEAGVFCRQGQLLFSHARYEAAIPLLETAHALQPKNVFYTGALFNNAWALHPLSRSRGLDEEDESPHHSNLELAQLASCLVRQIRRDYEQGLLFAPQIYDHWARSLGIEMGGGYFATAASVVSESVRMINRKNRKIWVETFDAALKKQWLREDFHPLNDRVRARLPWISSDDPEVLVANIKKAYTEFSTPPELGGKIESVAERHNTARHILGTRLPLMSFSLRESTHLRGSSDRFLELWLPCVKELSTSSGTQGGNRGNSSSVYTTRNINNKTLAARDSDNVRRVIELLKKDLQHSDLTIRRAALRELHALMTSRRLIGLDLQERNRLWEDTIRFLNEHMDIDSLVLLNPARRTSFQHDFKGAPQAVLRYYDLLTRTVQLLNTRRNEQRISRIRNQVKDFQAELRRTFPQLGIPEPASRLPVHMVLRAGEMGMRSPHSIVTKREDSVLWMAGMKSGRNATSVALGGIDLRTGKVYTPSMAECEFPHFPFRFTGMVIDDETVYLSVGIGGVVRFSKRQAPEADSLLTLNVLTHEHGLPSNRITSIAPYGYKLWVAYGNEGRESGLGIYDPKSKRWESVFCSSMKGDPPFSAGRPYEIRSLTPVSGQRLFFLADRIEDSGLWEMDTDDKTITYRGPFRNAGVTDCGDHLQLRTSYYVINYDRIDQGMATLFGDNERLKRMFREKRISLRLEDNLFSSEWDKDGNAFGPYRGGYLDLLRAVIHNDQLWALLGESQIIVFPRGGRSQDARYHENNILDGEPVSRFMSTPYGLVAIGEGMVGFVETPK